MRLRSVLAPEYLLRPSQIARRVRLQVRPKAQSQLARLPWQSLIEVRGGDDIGLSILHRGVYDLPVSETLWRLADPGETAIDAGANIGYMTSLLAARVGAAGSVHSFEAHPEIFGELSRNVARWNAAFGAAVVAPHHVALSDQAGEALLAIPDVFDSNRGTATLAATGGATRSIRVAAKRLDDTFRSETIGVMKVDVEGHEQAVFTGAERMLAEHRIRDIVFEDHSTYPTAVTRGLESLGYTIFVIGRGLLGPSLRVPRGERADDRWEAPSFLATCNEARAMQRLAKRSWHCLG